jgi:hypothetical protein
VQLRLALWGDTRDGENRPEQCGEKVHKAPTSFL